MPSPPTDSSAAEAFAAAARLIETLEQTADAFEHTAALAEQEAARRATAGRDDAEGERHVAARAREAVDRARAHADEWRRYLREKGAALAPESPEGARVSLEDLVEETEARAARARSHAEAARLLAAREAAQGDQAGVALHLREAATHEKAARLNEQTAALYRERISAQRTPPPSARHPRR